MGSLGLKPGFNGKWLLRHTIGVVGEVQRWKGCGLLYVKVQCGRVIQAFPKPGRVCSTNIKESSFLSSSIISAIVQMSL